MMPKVTYDNSLKFYMISPSAWTAVGSTQWFPNYRIIASLDTPLADKLGIIPLARYEPDDWVLPWRAEDILKSPLLHKVIARHHLEDYRRLLNRPSPVSAAGVLTNSYELASNYENKAWIRRAFSSTVRFPEFRIISLAKLRAHSFAGISEEFDDGIVIQHPTLNGGRGTYHVRDKASFEACINNLQQIMSDTDEVVVSWRLANAKERTLQGCVTKDKVLIGPPQTQLLAHPLLTSSRSGDIQFCGGMVAPGLLEDGLYQQASQYMQAIGQRLQAEGYRGIFGMDFLVSDGDIYAIEVNPRMTSLTTLLAFLQTEVPFLLLHILELANSPYVVTGTPSANLKTGSFIQVYAQHGGTISFKTGRYDSEGNRVSDGFEDGSILPDNGDFFVAMRVAEGQQVAQGKSLAFIYSRRKLFDDAGWIDPDVAKLVEKIRA